MDTLTTASIEWTDFEFQKKTAGKHGALYPNLVMLGS